MKKTILLFLVSMFLFVGCKNEVKKVEKVEPTPRPTSPINIPVVPKENKKLQSINEIEDVKSIQYSLHRATNSSNATWSHGNGMQEKSNTDCLGWGVDRNE